MNSLQLALHIKQAEEIFVWVKLSDKRGFYVKTTKIAILEYLDAEGEFDENIYIEFDEDSKELYIGRSEEDFESP